MTSTFFFIQSEVDVGLPLRTVGEAVEGKQVAFPVVPMKVESPVGTHRKQWRDEQMINNKNM